MKTSLGYVASVLVVGAVGSVHAHSHHHKRHAQVHRRQNETTGNNGIRPLAEIVKGMDPAPLVVAESYPPGSISPVPGAPPLPEPFVFVASEWPTRDRLPSADSPQVLEWMKELDGHDIPDLSITNDGDCAKSPAAAAQAAQRGWWTCGQTLRDTDISSCPTKGDWGVSFDDGPTQYSPKLLQYLKQANIHATFFVVGSRVVEWPNVLIAEYMDGHEISVHTWSHSARLTSLSNAQIVAELGWTREAIRRVLGVSPTTMRPPHGDIDDRVRAISMAMGMAPVMWTSSSVGAFDTNDWRVPGGSMTGPEQQEFFQTVLDSVEELDTGFIVLQHDLFEEQVELAIGYTLPSALSQSFSPKAIGECATLPQGNLYSESSPNQKSQFIPALAQTPAAPKPQPVKEVVVEEEIVYVTTNRPTSAADAKATELSQKAVKLDNSSGSLAAGSTWVFVSALTVMLKMLLN